MKIILDIPEHVLDDFQRTGFITRERRYDAEFLRELVAFLVVENARDLPTAMRFSGYLAQKREAKTLEWQAENAARNYYGNVDKKDEAA